MNTTTRRQFVQQTTGLVLGAALPAVPVRAAAPRSSGSFLDMSRAPDLVRVITESDTVSLITALGNRWTGPDIEVVTTPMPTGVTVTLSATTAAVKRIQLRWQGKLDDCRLFLGDTWERAYGDLEWRGMVPDRPMPWYFAAWDGSVTHGYGVMTGPKAFCFWQADSDGISLWADVRSGGSGVRLGNRVLDVCTVICRAGKRGETPFAALRDLCHQMCPKPRLADHPIYGHNDWNFWYGNNSADSTREVTHRLLALAPAGPNRPYVVIDDGWEPAGAGQAGPWDRGNEKFPDMPGLAAEVKKMGARPGLWIRPTTAWRDLPDTWRIPGRNGTLDPTVPDALHQIASDIGRLRQWGFDLVKHDFSSVDILGRFGNSMGSELASDGWTFREGPLRTTAEVVTEIYRTIREAAGDMVVLGCNTFSHLAAGYFEACRIGDDTSGQSWERTRKMGVNCLAFRNAQNGLFYATDPDIVAITRRLPWEKGRQWLDLVARSGSVLFLALEAAAVGPEQEAALKEALALVAAGQPVGEPRDWQATTCPRQWRMGSGHDVRYDWQTATGASPFRV